MSRFIKNLEFKPTGWMVPTYGPVPTLSAGVESDSFISPSQGYRQEHVMKLTLQTRCFLHQNAQPEMVHKAKESMIRQMANELYSEFYAPLDRALHEVRYGDPEDAAKEILAVIQTMKSTSVEMKREEARGE